MIKVTDKRRFDSEGNPRVAPDDCLACAGKGKVEIERPRNHGATCACGLCVGPRLRDCPQCHGRGTAR